MTNELGALTRSVVGMSVMHARNLFYRRRFPFAASGVTVSLTSYGARLRTAHLAVESILRGRVKPSRVILWIAEEERVARLPGGLRRLAARGVEIRYVQDDGPHKKYWPIISELDELPLAVVVADDDVIYPRYWLAELTEEHDRTGREVIAHRAALVDIDESGNIKPYVEWQHALKGECGPRVLPTGMGGVLYGRLALEAVAARGTGFRIVAPRADDLWLHACVVSAGFQPVQLKRTDRRNFADVRGSGAATLTSQNVGGGGNDEVFARLLMCPSYNAALRKGAGSLGPS